jgi:hypothetical protein
VSEIFSRSKWTPGLRPAFSVIPGLTRNPCSPGPIPSFLRKQSLPGSAVLPYSVIPAKAEPALDSIRGIHVRPAQFCHSGLDPESMSARPNCVIPAKAEPAPIRGPALFRHSCESRACPGLDPGNPCSSGPIPSFLRKQSLPGSAVLPYSVIPAKAGIHLHLLSKRDGGRISGRGRNIFGDLQPFDMDPGSESGVTDTEGTRIRPALFPSFRA